MILASAVLLIAVGGTTAWGVHLFRIATRDALDLAAKLAAPHPRCVADWPEVCIDVVVSDPAIVERVLVVARWPANPDPRAMLMLELTESLERARRLLDEWRDAGASVSPSTGSDAALIMRRRRTNDAVRARVVGETVCDARTSSRQL